MRRAPGSVLATMLLGVLCACSSPPKPESVVLVVVDTLRADHLGAYGYTRDTTPLLDELVPEARVFEMALATSPWTLPSFGSILSGRWPAEHGAGGRMKGRRPPDLPKGAKWTGALDPTLPTLAALAKDGGLHTGAIINNSWLKPRLGVSRGFDTYDLHPARNSHNRPAAEIVDAALEWIDALLDEPFFLVIHLFEPHLSYRPPPSVRGRFMSQVEEGGPFPVRDTKKLRRLAPTMSEARREYIVAVYDEEIAYVDLELGRLFQGLRERGVWDRSLVLLTADHGEELFDHNGFEHGHTMYQELLRVPLLAWGPGVVPGREPAPVSTVDIAPTVLDALGIEAPELSGVSLWPSLTKEKRPPRRPIYADRTLYGPNRRALVRWPYKLISVEGRAEHLFDLEKDPRETRNLLQESPDLVRELESEMKLMDARQAPSAPVQLDEDTVRDLRSLGYVD